MRVRASRLTGRAAASARANQVRAEVSALTRESRVGVYRTDVPFAAEDRPGYLRRCTAEQVERIRELSGQNWSQLAIATELGISQGAVGNVRQRYGIAKGPAARPATASGG